VSKIVLATFGTHGDLNPFIGVALALRRAGLNPVVATHAEYRPLVESAGIAFHALRPDRGQLEMNSEAQRAHTMRAARRRPQVILQRFVLPYLEQSYEDALAIVDGAALVFASSLSFGARLAAETLRVPSVAVVLQPSMLWSATDPTLFGDHATARWLHAGGPGVNRAALGVIRRISRHWGRPIERFRRRLGQPAGGHPLFEGQWDGAARVLGLYSALLGDRQPDHPANLLVAGFSFYDGGGELPLSLRQFMDDGPPPLVFTLGTSAVHDSRQFVTVALAALEALRERAVLVLDEDQCRYWQSRVSGRVYVSAYLPYSEVFPRARLIVHHGGIGTTAQALRAGRPQLIAPYFVDQPDNAMRVKRLGAGRVVPHARWTAATLMRELQSLREDTAIAQRATAMAAHIMAEDGATTAARLARELLRTPT
jgi:rhamnosyltransferase subunit B